MIIVYHQMDPTQTDVLSTVITRRLLNFPSLLIILTKSTHLVSQSAQGTYSYLWHGLRWIHLAQYISCIKQLQQNLSSKLSFYLIQDPLFTSISISELWKLSLEHDHIDLCLEPAELSRGCPSHQNQPQTLISHMVLHSSPKRSRSRILVSKGYRVRVSHISVNPSCRVSKWTES